jgi:hypothetical protein
VFSNICLAQSTALTKYDTSLTLGYKAMIGSDDVHSSVKITTPLIPGIDFNYYSYEEPLTLVLGISYKNIKFNDDNENNIAVENVGSQHDINFKIYTLWDIFDRTRFAIGLRYVNHYFFQSKPSQAFVEAQSSLGVIGDLGLEYDVISSEDLTATVQGSYGLAAAISGFKSGNASFLGIKINQKYSPEMNLIYSISYAEINTSTLLSDSTIASSQGLGDLNLKLGIQKIF